MRQADFAAFYYRTNLVELIDQSVTGPVRYKTLEMQMTRHTAKTRPFYEHCYCYRPALKDADLPSVPIMMPEVNLKYKGLDKETGALATRTFRARICRRTPYGDRAPIP